ncbi:MAG: hypothetical protein Q4C70_03880 [Planctomycetia bacterium]|nr:hypothetical protein [Planctomycetia bacterium]
MNYGIAFIILILGMLIGLFVPKFAIITLIACVLFVVILLIVFLNHIVTLWQIARFLKVK